MHIYTDVERFNLSIKTWRLPYSSPNQPPLITETQKINTCKTTMLHDKAVKTVKKNYPNNNIKVD